MLVNKFFYFLFNYIYRVNNGSSYPRLLHSIKFDENDLDSLIDVITSKTYPLKNSIHPSYKGENILDTNFDMRILKEKNELKQCKFYFN